MIRAGEDGYLIHEFAKGFVANRLDAARLSDRQGSATVRGSEGRAVFMVRAPKRLTSLKIS